MSTKSFDELVRPEIERLFRLAYRLTNMRADAEDLVQDVLLKAYERRDELTSIKAIGPWLGRVLYNGFIDNRRRYERRRLAVVDQDSPGEISLVDRQPSQDPALDDAAALQLDIKQLNAGLAELSMEHRAVLLMHDAEGYKLEEIQTITGIPIGTLKSRLHRARGRLREILVGLGTF
jgi:RNA polymerase sigma-70 factor (ECF subfamily)